MLSRSLRIFIKSLRQNAHGKTKAIPLWESKVDLKKVFSIVMIATVMFPSLTRIGIFIDFIINEDFIAEVLCVNKDEPITVCNGKCYLAKQINKTEDKQEKQAPNTKNEKLEAQQYCFAENLFHFSRWPEHHSGLLGKRHKNEVDHSAFITDIFHPPQHTIV